jgi:two-component system sensor histidine kinase ChiS
LLTLKKAAQENDQLSVMQQEMKVARRIQSLILPHGIPNINGVKVLVYYSPVEEVGGDFYDFHISNELGLGVLIADVMGHGFHAAFLTSLVKIAFASELALAKSPDKVLGQMNETLTGKCRESYLTAGYGYFDIKNQKFIYARAGHKPALLLRGNKVKKIQDLGDALGLKEVIKIKTSSVDIQSGDRIILYTDGIVEVSNESGNLFGEKRCKKLLTQYKDLNSKQLMDNIYHEIRQWHGENKKFDDDVTILIIDIT